jgi:hypothetical protein
MFVEKKAPPEQRRSRSAVVLSRGAFAVAYQAKGDACENRKRRQYQHRGAPHCAA